MAAGRRLVPISDPVAPEHTLSFYSLCQLFINSTHMTHTFSSATMHRHITIKMYGCSSMQTWLGVDSRLKSSVKTPNQRSRVLRPPASRLVDLDVISAQCTSCAAGDYRYVGRERTLSERRPFTPEQAISIKTGKGKIYKCSTEEENPLKLKKLQVSTSAGSFQSNLAQVNEIESGGTSGLEGTGVEAKKSGWADRGGTTRQGGFLAEEWEEEVVLKVRGHRHEQQKCDDEGKSAAESCERRERREYKKNSCSRSVTTDLYHDRPMYFPIHHDDNMTYLVNISVLKHRFFYASSNLAVETMLKSCPRSPIHLWDFPPLCTFSEKSSTCKLFPRSHCGEPSEVSWWRRNTGLWLKPNDESKLLDLMRDSAMFLIYRTRNKHLKYEAAVHRSHQKRVVLRISHASQARIKMEKLLKARTPVRANFMKTHKAVMSETDTDEVRLQLVKLEHLGTQL
ncbi:hypothetical protein PR048_021123 [Dryococelus australis]|uniref:Uncharacterized protein n=1 Tax=Dryococelus australis TaxID=614101 RepID=A0ABQ9GXB8_9NEOP|nr:hypothetical protein PR048_021123 [Dryococelus australis]